MPSVGSGDSVYSQPIRELSHAHRSIVTFQGPNRFSRGDVLRLYLPVFDGQYTQPRGIRAYSVLVLASGPRSVETTLSTLTHGRIDVSNSYIRYYGQFRAYKIGEMRG